MGCLVVKWTLLIRAVLELLELSQGEVVMGYKAVILVP